VFKTCGRVPLYSEESYQEPGWVSIFLGQHVFPKRYDPIIDNIDIERLQRGMSHRRGAIRRLAEALPGHRDYIASHCPAVSS
jgi:tryptophan 7-halogenase